MVRMQFMLLSLERLSKSSNAIHCQLVNVNIALSRFLHNHGHIATEGSSKSEVYAFLLQYKDFNPYSAGLELSRQNLTSVDVRFWRLKSIPAL